MFRQISLIVFLSFCCVVATVSNTAGQSKNGTGDGDVAASTSIAPPSITPRKDLFVTREGDPFVVTVTATCLLEDDSEPQFELVSSTPGFIHVSDAYRKEHLANGYVEGMGVLYVTPQLGDAGKYVVSLQVKACNGKVERLITFKLHVKQARQD